LGIVDRVRERGPLTVAAFMDLALYDHELGYYARAVQRSGRTGDFFTSVDVGPLFGELLERQIAEMAAILGGSATTIEHVALVEAGAGNGRLSADILRAARRRDPDLLKRLRLHLVEASATARAAQRETLGDLAPFLATSGAALPESFEGVLLANELIDAMPVHQVAMTTAGLREIYVEARGAGLEAVEGPLSTADIERYLARAGADLQPGWRAEVNLHAVDWMRDAARRLRRGFMILIDYGHRAAELYSASHAGGTLTTFSRHHEPSAISHQPSPWLESPGERDLTAHVDFTTLQAVAEEEGMTTIGLLDQTYFLLGIASGEPPDALAAAARAFKTLVMPGGLGSTHKVLLLAKNAGAPALRGCSYRVRMT